MDSLVFLKKKKKNLKRDNIVTLDGSRQSVTNWYNNPELPRLQQVAQLVMFRLARDTNDLRWQSYDDLYDHGLVSGESPHMILLQQCGWPQLIDRGTDTIFEQKCASKARSWE